MEIVIIIGMLVLGMFFGAVMFNQVNKFIYGSYYERKQQTFYIIGAICGAVASCGVLYLMFTL